MVLVDLIKNAVVEASTTYRKDQLDAYKRAVRMETNENAKWVLELLLDNARIADANRIPLCDDTGVPHIIIEVGNNTRLPGWFFHDITTGIACGLKELPGRPMAVKGNSIDRIEQSKGLYKSSEKLTISFFHCRHYGK